MAQPNQWNSGHDDLNGLCWLRWGLLVSDVENMANDFTVGVMRQAAAELDPPRTLVWLQSCGTVAYNITHGQFCRGRDDRRDGFVRSAGVQRKHHGVPDHGMRT